MSSSADALCGPSNPLQQFKQHTSLDHTLLQDRLTTSRNAHPGQGFRSPDPRGGLLDAEFEAFQAGVPVPADLPEFYPPQQYQQPAPAAFAGTATGPDWAADFHRRLHISSAAPPSILQQQQQRPPTADWARGFLSQTAPRAPQNSSTSPLAFQQRARYGGYVPGGFQSAFAPPQPALEMTAAIEGKGKERMEVDFDDEAFERAFEQAREDLLTETEGDVAIAMKEHVEAEEARTMESEAILDATDSSTLNALPKETNLQVDGIQEEQRIQPDDEDDALAATAQELLDKVQHHQSDKFRQSHFLSLMRRFADREVRVRDNQVVEVENATTNTSSTATAPLTHHTSPSAALRFDNTEQRPSPLLDTRPPEYGVIPPHEQDLDVGRDIDPRDGQAVVDLLNQPGGGGVGEDVGTSFSLPDGEVGSLPEGPPFYGDWRAVRPGDLGEVLYGPGGTLEGSGGVR